MSVVITTFNQEEFISQCIESVFMQHGDFDLEVIVGDDNQLIIPDESLIIIRNNIHHRLNYCHLLNALECN